MFSTLAELKKGGDLAFAQRLAAYIGESEFTDSIPDGQKKDVGEKLYLPLARLFFQRNTKSAQRGAI